VSVDILSNAACRLEELSIQDNFIPMPKLNAMMTNLAESSDLKLRALDLDGLDLDISSNILAHAVCKIEKVDLSGNEGGDERSSDHLNALFHNIKQCSTSKLRMLCLSMNDLSEVDTDLLASLVCGLEKVDLSLTQLRTTQLNRLLYTINKNDNLKLKKLNLMENMLHDVDIDIFSDVVCKLEEVWLQSTGMKAKHLASIFVKIRKQHNTKIKTLNLSRGILPFYTPGNELYRFYVDDDVKSSVYDRNGINIFISDSFNTSGQINIRASLNKKELPVNKLSSFF
jgi:hypothetical protein